MAATPKWKVYTAAGQYEAACHSVETAAAVVALLGDGATIRHGHGRADIVWREGEDRDGRAHESYDHVVDVVMERARKAVAA